MEIMDSNTLSASYQTGLTLGRRLFSGKGVGGKIGGSAAPTCMDRISDELAQQLRSGSAFREHDQLLAQITDVDRRAKICRVWSAQRGYLADCETEVRDTGLKNVRPTGLMSLLHVICDENSIDGTLF